MMLATDLDSESPVPESSLSSKHSSEHAGEGFSKIEKILALRPSRGAA